ncbi:MAG: ADP-ribosylglycohydrolase family protein, partial [Chloroflexota bacterium]
CALIFQSDFKGGVRAAANHSGDCDSTGAVTGNILGALLGSDSIPTDWIDNLAEARVVEKLSGDILKVLAGDPETMLPSWMDSYLSD